MDTAYKFEIRTGIPVKKIKEKLKRAAEAAEGQFGLSEVLLDGVVEFYPAARVCLINQNKVGKQIALLFTSFMRQAFGPNAFRIKRVRWKWPYLTQSLGKKETVCGE